MARFPFTGDGRTDGPRIAACVYLVIGAIELFRGGWRSLEWIGWLLLALGFIGMSTHQESAKTGRSLWGQPSYVLGVAVALLGLATMVYSSLVHRHH